MPNYTVTVKTISYEYWDVTTDNEEEAKDKYWEVGTLLDTDIVDADIVLVEEM